MKKSHLISIGIFILLFILDMGLIHISDEYASENAMLFWNFRFPRVMAAALSGMSLSIAGLSMQTLFRNPLAGPYLLGITPGSSLMIAIISIAFPFLSALNYWAFSGTVIAAFIGAMSVMLLQLMTAKYTKGIFTLLLIGVMLGYLFSAFTDLLQVYATAEQIKNFVLWGMGSFDRVIPQQIPYLGSITLFGILGVFLLRNKMNSYLVGDFYAQNAGLHLKKFKLTLMILCGILSASVTAFCGPISFVGLASPHLARLSLKTDNHSKLFFSSALWGGSFTLLADFLSHAPWFELQWTVSAVCSIIGAPVVLYVLWKRKD